MRREVDDQWMDDGREWPSVRGVVVTPCDAQWPEETTLVDLKSKPINTGGSPTSNTQS